jgi:hypothetical protein
MSGFLYYVPESPQIKLARLRELGLGYAFDSQPPQTQVARGPDGRPGAVLAGHGCPPHLAKFYAPDDAKRKQRWVPLYTGVQSAECGVQSGEAASPPAAWVGMYDDARPTPADLVRPAPISGESVAADDGSQWLVPHARRFEMIEDDPELPILWAANLPRRLTLTATGWESGDVKPRYQRLWQLACAYLDAVQSAMDAEPEEPIENQPAGQPRIVRFEFQEADNLAVLALCTNYHVAHAELELLQVFDDELRRAVIDVLLDNRTFDKLLKKKQASGSTAAGSTSSFGPGPPSAASPPTTGTDPP